MSLLTGGLIGFLLAHIFVWFGYWLVGGEFERGAADIGGFYLASVFFGAVGCAVGCTIASEIAKARWRREKEMGASLKRAAHQEAREWIE